MHRGAKIISVFGSSLPLEENDEYIVARRLGTQLAVKGFIVCTGGYGGVMAAISQGAKDAGGRVIGVTTSFFQAKPNQWLDEEVRVKTWQDRLFQLIDRGDGYVVCPGGTGTLVELAVVWEMVNKGVMPRKPVVVLGEFWKPVIDRIRQGERDEKSPWTEKQGALLQFAESPSDAADLLASNFE